MSELGCLLPAAPFWLLTVREPLQATNPLVHLRGLQSELTHLLGIADGIDFLLKDPHVGLAGLDVIVKLTEAEDLPKEAPVVQVSSGIAKGHKFGQGASEEVGIPECEGCGWLFIVK